MDLEKLIGLVRENDFLYNFNHKSYHDAVKKDTVWRAIGKKLNMSGRDCKKHWTGLRDSFRRNLKKRKLSPETHPYVKKWKFEEEMTFIQPFLKERTVIPSLSSDEDSEPAAGVDDSVISAQQNESINDSKTIMQIVKTEESSMSETIIKYLMETRRDEVETLFYSLAQTVKKMSPYYQALAKARVCSAVSELELENLAQESNAESSYTAMSKTIPSPAISHSSINVSSPVSSPQTSSVQSLATQLNTEMPDIKPF